VLGRAVVAGHKPGIEIDASVIGSGLGLETSQVQALMQAEKISMLCERGTAEDLGCHRVTFYYANRRFRILIDTTGRIFETS
jgi:hypothetical protein